eukprot:3148620-Pleurochrysis_carterae.AAC.2
MESDVESAKLETGGSAGSGGATAGGALIRIEECRSWSKFQRLQVHISGSPQGMLNRRRLSSSPIITAVASTCRAAPPTPPTSCRSPASRGRRGERTRCIRCPRCLRAGAAALGEAARRSVSRVGVREVVDRQQIFMDGICMKCNRYDAFCSIV